MKLITLVVGLTIAVLSCQGQYVYEKPRDTVDAATFEQMMAEAQPQDDRFYRPTAGRNQCQGKCCKFFFIAFNCLELFFIYFFILFFLFSLCAVLVEQSAAHQMSIVLLVAHRCAKINIPGQHNWSRVAIFHDSSVVVL